jgi:hypothetical protein
MARTRQTTGDKAALVEQLGKMAYSQREAAGYYRTQAAKREGRATADGIDLAARLVRDWQMAAIDRDTLADVLGELDVYAGGHAYQETADMILEKLAGRAGGQA